MKKAGTQEAKMGGDFVNRHHEFMFMTDWVRMPSQKNKGIFVYAKSGIGKSQFVDELFEQKLPDYTKVHVKMAGADPSAVSSFSFLERLYRKVINNTEKKSALPLQSRISLERTLSVSHIAGIEVSLLEKSGYGDRIATIVAYLQKKLTDSLHPYIIAIENFHQIDSDSLECMEQLFQIGNKHRFIFECTIDPANIEDNFFRLVNHASHFLECEVYKLERLPLNELYLLCEKKHLPYETAKDLYEENGGNLYPIIMLPHTKDIQSRHPIQDVINNLGSDQQLILFLAAFNDGSISVKSLQNIFISGTNILAGNQKYTQDHILCQCIELQQKKIIEIENREISIFQDQLLEGIRACRQNPLYYLAGNLYETYHYNELHNVQDKLKEPHILALLRIYTFFSNSKIISIIPELTRIALQGPPKEIINKILKIKTQLSIYEENGSLLDFLTQYIADLCIGVGQWRIALEQVNERYSADIPWQACYLAATLASNPHVPGAETRILDLRQKHRMNRHIYMSITVSLLSFYMRTLPEAQVKKIGERYIEEFQDYQTLNYAFLLKIYSNVLSNEDALTTLEKCNQIFRKYNRYDLVSMNDITAASRYVYLGEPETGLNILTTAEKEISDKNIPIRKYYFQNNRAAIHLLMGNYTEKTESDLLAARYTADSDFEKAIILCNLMIYYILTNKKDTAGEIFQQLQVLDLSAYKNTDLDFIMKQNALYYYDSIGDEHAASNAKSQLIDLAMSIECPLDIKAHILSYFPLEYPTYSNSTKPFLANYRYHPDFIGYWQCEVCYDDSGQNILTTYGDPSSVKNFES